MDDNLQLWPSVYLSCLFLFLCNWFSSRKLSILYYNWIYASSGILCGIMFYFYYKYNLTIYRCMTTRRDIPDGSLWRLAVEGFNRILVSDVGRLCQGGESEIYINRSSRNRIWKEVADVFEIFLVGYCGRALQSNFLSPAALEADISLDMAFLSILGDKILKSQIDAPSDVIFFLMLQRFSLVIY